MSASCSKPAAAIWGISVKSAGQAQRFLAAHDQINNLFQLRRDHLTAIEHRAARATALAV